MKKLVFLLALSCTLVGCKDSYRYACQDPDNFGKAECQHPKCEVQGYCSDELVGHKVYADIEENKTGGDSGTAPSEPAPSEPAPSEPAVVESK
jgi:hypothetical protein